MKQVSVVIPNYNGIEYLPKCLSAMKNQTMQDIEVLVVDNASTDGSVELIRKDYPWVQLICLEENTGFCGGVNRGIRESQGEYVILLNNDTMAEPDFAKELYCSIKDRPQVFSCSAKMVQMHDPAKMDDAGDYYCALGWAFQRGKGKPVADYDSPHEIFFSCAGAAIYRRSILDEIGLFDENHFAYLEDADLGYRARIQGYKNYYEPKAVVAHVGSGTSGSVYNLFKTRYSSRNNVYLIYKNMPFLQIILNLPFLILGFGAKIVFFALKGFGKDYLTGIVGGFSLCKKGKAQGKKVQFRVKNLHNYIRIQWELWRNLFLRFFG